ncbi:GNAT family N-acetyltransferase [Opitutus sp. ER46]|uniref:GNAT family N-acetyltransferase n=1 Tax=Opitutus sp. ER46 TaxID=2161864 RepID=UPI000D31D691|nr:GNAT family N-acetyltransferase [Opitutus sp. ER46]PTX90977.1 hypothetical protein DB354_20220 [Opitutus sp. ER46]
MNADLGTEASWQRFLTAGLLGGVSLVSNADVEVAAWSVGQEPVPLVINRRGDRDCSWVASLRNAYGPYARAETDIVKMSRWVRPWYLAGSLAAERLLAAGGLAGGAYLNNWMLATNLYRTEFSAAAVLAGLDDLVRAVDGLPIVIRSLTPPLHATLIQELAAAGFLLLPSRQVWIVDDPASGEWRTHRDPRRDLELARSTASQWAWVPEADFTPEDYAQAWRLYQRLYRERYPRFNPDYTAELLRLGAATGFLEIHGLRRAEGGPLVGFVGMAHRGAQSCTPLLGYDIDAPASLGLYRRLMLRAFLTCERRQSRFHCSAGAGSFKYNRGARASVEYAAVWANHLPAYRRAGLRTLSRVVMASVVPYLETHRC